MKSFKHLVLPTLAGLSLSLAAHAQVVYRCGNSYSQTPCADGKAISTDDSRTDAQRAAAREGLARDKALAKELDTDRRKEEAQVWAREKEAMTARNRQDAKAKAESQKAQAKSKPAKEQKRKAAVKTNPDEPFTAQLDNGKGKKKKAP